MKFLNKIAVCLLLIVGVTACDNLDLDLVENPNAVTPDAANLDDLYFSVQGSLVGMYDAAQFRPGAMARMYQWVSYTYNDAAPANTLNGMWGNIYNGMFPDVDAVLAITEEDGLDIHAGSAKIMKAYALMVAVDLLGDIPFSEAGQGIDIISPNHDEDEAVYDAAIALLDEAIAQLDGTTAAPPAYDNFADGDPDKWIKIANTIKLRAALNMGDATAFMSIINDDNFIKVADDDFQVNFGSQRTNPNSRHPFYNTHYEVNDGDYISNYYMWLLIGDKETSAGVNIVDPRIRYYFYRKVDDSANQDETTYSCHLSALPDQSAKPDAWDSIDPDLPYCYADASGYIGRDHLNGEGIPPDGPIRTSYGLYPAGGDFDDDTFDDTRENGTTGGLGEGIHPILLSSFVDFMRAEAALTMGTGEDARALLEAGIEKSLDKVESFESLVSTKMGTTVILRDGSEGTIKELYGMDDDSKQAYIDAVLAIYDAATTDDERLGIVVKEYYIAAWGNGIEAYNMWRRTGKPANMQPALDPPGQFTYTFLLPDNHVARNQNVTQKALTDRVFWDPGLTLY